MPKIPVTTAPAARLATPPAPSGVGTDGNLVCDRCGARAYVKADLPSGGELYFCGHHGRRHGPALLRAGAFVDDRTELLLKRPEIK